MSEISFPTLGDERSPAGGDAEKKKEKRRMVHVHMILPSEHAL